MYSKILKRYHVKMNLHWLPLSKFTTELKTKKLRAIFCNSQAKWEMKKFDPTPRKFCMSKNALCSGSFFTVVMVTPIVCWWQKKN